MRKRELLAGTYNVYCIFDKISKHYIKMYFATNDEDLIRKYLPEIILSVPLRELQIFKIGIFNDVTGELKSSIRKRVDTSCYLFPHSRLSPEGENLTHEEVEKAVLETKNKIITESDDSEKNKED